MKTGYGCIGEHLKHSFSKEIHNALADYDYGIIEIPKDELEDFIRKAEFKAINVTIPYKEAIIPYLYQTDESAKLIGAVNTVVNKDGKLYGYNTDFYGMSMLCQHAGISPMEKKVAILGSGGTSKTAFAVMKALGAKDIIRVSREGRENAITYDELYKNHLDTEIIINTTPVGMFPKIFSSPIDISFFENLCGVIDAVYNPLSTELILAARKRNIPAEGGLYMLVAQAVRASEIFLGIKYESGTLDKIYKKILSEKENIVLTGMPASGKSTVGKLLAKKMGRDFVDTDKLIEEKAKKTIPDIFSEHGEDYFRELERETIREVSAKCNLVIATGGGAILNNSNIANLSKNGKIYFIDRPLEALIPTDDRPLAKDKEAIKKRYFERYEIYKSTSDRQINADIPAEDVTKTIMKDFFNENICN